MNMQGSTIRLLEAAHFTTPQAVAIAEAVDTGIRSAELVTLPTLNSALDSRFAQTEARTDAKLAQLELRLVERIEDKVAGLDRKMFGLSWAALGIGLTATGLIIGAVRYMH